MGIPVEPQDRPITLKTLPRNVWATSLTSFLMDISSEMVINLLPLFLANVLGIKTNLIGLIEGVAEATSSLLKIFSGWLSDRLGTRKNLAVAGYAHFGPGQTILRLRPDLDSGRVVIRPD